MDWSHFVIYQNPLTKSCTCELNLRIYMDPIATNNANKGRSMAINKPRPKTSVTIAQRLQLYKITEALIMVISLEFELMGTA